MQRENWLVIGISGATCTGKSSVAKEIEALFINSVVVHQDDYFFDIASDRHTRIPELNHINFEILSSIDMDALKSRVYDVLNSEVEIDDFEERRTYLEDKFRAKFETGDIIPINECIFERIQNMKRIPNLLIVEGFLIFNDDELYQLCDLRFYFTLRKTSCWERRKVRTYDPPDVPGYFEKYVWPLYLKHYEEVLKKPGIRYMDATHTSMPCNMKAILHKILIQLS